MSDHTASKAIDSITLGTANIAAGASAGSGMLTFLNENAGAIGVLVSLATFLTALIFYILNYRMKVKATNLYHEELRDEVLEDLLAHLQSEAGTCGVPVQSLPAVKLALTERRSKVRRHHSSASS